MRRPARSRQPVNQPLDSQPCEGRRGSLLALCLFALLFSVYLLTFSGRYHSSDEMSMLAATDSLARRGAWDVELIRWMGEQQASFGPDGLLYSRKGIGTTLAALPLYWLAVQTEYIGNVQAAMLTNGIVTALTGVLVFLFLRRLRYGSGVALGTALAFGLGTMAWPYARYLFSESLAGLGLMACAYFLLHYRDEGDGVSVLLAGAGLGVALLTRLSNAIVAPFLALLLLLYLRRPLGADHVARGAPPGQELPDYGPAEAKNWRAYVVPILLFGLPVLAALAVSGWYNWLRFGSPLTTGYLPEERFATPFFEGLYGLTFSPGKGLFWYNPLFFAALAAWPAFLRRHRAEALLVAAVVSGTIAFYASWYLWWAGHGWGPRFLVTILPFAILPLAPALEAASQRRLLAIALGAVGLASVAVQLLGVAVNFNLYLEDIYAELGLYHPATFLDPAYSPLLRQIAYLRPGNWDLAWARGNSVDWLPLLAGVLLVLVSALALWAAWRQRWSDWAGRGLVATLVLGALISLIYYQPKGDMTAAARKLAAMEHPGEAAALTEPLHTEAFQDAYDSHLWVWGVPSAAEVGGKHEAVWTIGVGDSTPAAARFQVATVRLDYFPATGKPFDTSRLPVPPLQEKVQLGTAVELAAFEIGQDAVRPGRTLPLALFWRTLVPMDNSYTVFIQAIDESGVKAGQIDRLPCDGGCATTTWRPGDLIGEWYSLPIRTDAPPGRYQVIAGMYDLATGERLPHLDAAGSTMGTYLLLGSVEIQQ
jgi:hypothetical protein